MLSNGNVWVISIFFFAFYMRMMSSQFNSAESQPHHSVDYNPVEIWNGLTGLHVRALHKQINETANNLYESSRMINVSDYGWSLQTFNLNESVIDETLMQQFFRIKKNARHSHKHTRKRIVYELPEIIDFQENEVQYN